MKRALIILTCLVIPMSTHCGKNRSPRSRVTFKAPVTSDTFADAFQQHTDRRFMQVIFNKKSKPCRVLRTLNLHPSKNLLNDALSYVAQKNRKNDDIITKWLLLAGANPNQPDEDDIAPLQYAGDDGGIASILCLYGADPDNYIYGNEVPSSGKARMCEAMKVVLKHGNELDKSVSKFSEKEFREIQPHSQFSVAEKTQLIQELKGIWLARKQCVQQNKIAQPSHVTVTFEEDNHEKKKRRRLNRSGRYSTATL